MVSKILFTKPISFFVLFDNTSTTFQAQLFKKGKILEIFVEKHLCQNAKYFGNNVPGISLVKKSLTVQNEKTQSGCCKKPYLGKHLKH